jgi:hypothetical protein
VLLEPNELRPIEVSRLHTNESPKRLTLESRLDQELRDGRLFGYPVMVILCDTSDSASKFVEENLLSYQSNRDVASFLQLMIARDESNLKDEDKQFLRKHGWHLPPGGQVHAYVLDSQGAEVGRIGIAMAKGDATEKVAAFLATHCPKKVDAEKKWQDAFAEAKRSNRKVWVRISQRNCNPCFSLARWLDDHHAMLEKDYVMLKIDDWSDENGTSVAQRVTGGRRFGIPFHAIFDWDQKLLIDSEGVLGNIGFPSGYEGRKHMRKMLMTTRERLVDAEIEQIVDSLSKR